MKKALGYIRVSSEEQADHGLGLESQRQRINAYCEMKGLVLTTIFEDPAVSGGKPLANRPSGARLLAEARRTKPVVVVAKLDRLFRSVADAAQTITSFDRYGIELVAISEGFDMTNPYGRAMAQMASVFAELERAMIRERTRAAMKVKRGRSERISGHAPFGWDFWLGCFGAGRKRFYCVLARHGTSGGKQYCHDRICAGIRPFFLVRCVGQARHYSRKGILNERCQPLRH
jgi:DNA invertase Pin-like site-specific DNA recombinase